MKTVIDSPNLASYDLPKGLSAVLQRFDDMCAWMEKGGHPRPERVLLFRRDYLAIDRVVRHASDGQRNASQVRWRGLPLAAQ